MTNGEVNASKRKKNNSTLCPTPKFSPIFGPKIKLFLLTPKKGIY